MILTSRRNKLTKNFNKKVNIPFETFKATTDTFPFTKIFLSDSSVASFLSRSLQYVNESASAYVCKYVCV